MSSDSGEGVMGRAELASPWTSDLLSLMYGRSPHASMTANIKVTGLFSVGARQEIPPSLCTTLKKIDVNIISLDGTKDLSVQRFVSDRDTQRKRQRGEFKMVWFPNVPSLVGAGFRAAVLQCAAAAAAARDSCQRYFGVISDRFAKDTRLRALLYISLV